MKALSQSEYGNLRNLYESIYAPQEVDEEIEISFESLAEAAEEVVFDLIDEGYDIEDIDEMFDDELIEEIIDEARVTMGRGGSAGAGKVTTGSGSRMAAKSRLDARKSEKRAETVRKTKKAGRDVIDKPAREYAAKRKIVPSRSGKQKLNKSSLEAKQRTSAGRREIRGRVAKDIASRAKETAGKAIRGAVASAQMKTGDSSKSASARLGRAADRAGSAVKSAASGAKRGLKGMIGKAARKVAGGADRVAKRMGEEFETYDVVVEFLCDYGIAENLQEAQWMMVNEIDSEDIETILEAYGLDEAQQIMSVSKGGKQIYKAPRSEPSNEPSPHKKRRTQQLKRAQKNADRRDNSPARERAFDRYVSGTDTPLNRTRTSNIKKLNAPTEPNRSNDGDPYRTVRTDYSARKRRESGR